MSAGSTTDCMFRAFDARGGKMLWETTPALFGMHGVSSSRLVNGEQCIAMPSG